MRDAALAVAVLLVVAILVYRHTDRVRTAAEADRRAGVRARLWDLAVTDTELLVGQKVGDALHYPLQDWQASVDDANGSNAYLKLSAPDAEILRMVNLRKNKSGGLQARWFAQELNVRARRLSQQS